MSHNCKECESRDFCMSIGMSDGEQQIEPADDFDGDILDDDQDFDDEGDDDDDADIPVVPFAVGKFPTRTKFSVDGVVLEDFNVDFVTATRSDGQDVEVPRWSMDYNGKTYHVTADPDTFHPLFGMEFIITSVE